MNESTLNLAGLAFSGVVGFMLLCAGLWILIWGRKTYQKTHRWLEVLADQAGEELPCPQLSRAGLQVIGWLAHSQEARLIMIVSGAGCALIGALLLALTLVCFIQGVGL